MGQLGSRVSRSSVVQSTGSARPPPDLVLKLPVDIILRLCYEYLQPASAVALSLTCKSLFGLINSSAKSRTKLDSANLETLLLLLEKDLGSGWYYCHVCTVLHPFSQDSHSALHISPWTLKMDPDDCRQRNIVCLIMINTEIRYRYIRLAMNRHFYGPPNGISLEKFQLKTHLCGGQWKERWSARIIEDELFLSATRTLPWTPGTSQLLRDIVDKKWFGICLHVRTGITAKNPVNSLYQTHPTPDSPFAPCWDVVESCPKCLTDHDTTV